MARPATRRPGPLRIGYLSADLRNHVMGKMMWQAIAHHDHARLESYFYANSNERDEWTQRFESAGKRFAVIAGLDDARAAALIADDDLDILVDLSTHTRGARPGILARKPARVQITHIASAGPWDCPRSTTSSPTTTPTCRRTRSSRSSACWRWTAACFHSARRAGEPASLRSTNLGLAADAIVIGAFVSPLAVAAMPRFVARRAGRIRAAADRRPAANPALRDSYLRLAQAAGIARERIVFLPQGRDDAENQARYRLVDFVLDTMPFGGVNGTIEALDMGVPVVTLVGKRHGERTSFSILRNLGVTATIANTGREYAGIAARLADEPAFRAEVSAAIAAGLAQSPLVDMVAHTRNLEAAYRFSTRRARREVSAHG
jgi:predicted O-linked N-acetylglucosamine transferase (SPINDLY family)